MSIIAFLKELLTLWNSHFSAEARLRRKMVREAEREGESKVKAERLKAKYAAIDKEGKKDAEKVAQELTTRFGGSKRKPRQ